MKRIKEISVLSIVVIFAALGAAARVDANIQGSKSWLQKMEPILQSPVFVTSLMKEPIDWLLAYADKHRVYRKTMHIYDSFKERGISLALFDINPSTLPDRGVNFRNGLFETSRVGSSGIKYERTDMLDGVLGTDLGFSIWGRSRPDRELNDAGLRLFASELFERQMYAAFTLHHKNLVNEDFFGVGRTISVNDELNFNLQETSYSFVVGKEEILRDTNFELGVGYSDVRVRGGEEKHPIAHFQSLTGREVPGIGGADLLSYGFSISHDTRNNKHNPTAGTREELALSWNHGLHGDEKVNYWKLKAEALQYLPLAQIFPSWSLDKVLSFAETFEHNQPFENGTIPFFDMARLDRKLSRAYSTNRYFDRDLVAFSLKYRYAIWQWGDLAIDSALFFEGGWIFNGPDDFRFADFKESYGCEWRFVLPQSHAMTFYVARSDEGYEVLLKWNPRF